jgi:hypothetical protein
MYEKQSQHLSSVLRDLLDRIALAINAPAGLVAMNAPRAIFTPTDVEQLPFPSVSTKFQMTNILLKTKSFSLYQVIHFSCYDYCPFQL